MDMALAANGLAAQPARGMRYNAKEKHALFQLSAVLHAPNIHGNGVDRLRAGAGGIAETKADGVEASVLGLRAKDAGTEGELESFAGELDGELRVKVHLSVERIAHRCAEACLGYITIESGPAHSRAQIDRFRRKRNPHLRISSDSKEASVVKERTQSTSVLLGANGPLPDKQRTRLDAILKELRQSGTVSVETLSAELGVSVVTIRRDLDQLERDGLLHRTHGGAVSIEPLFYEPFKNDRSFQAQLERYADEKRRIGRAAATLVEKGETIALTPGTTTVEVIRGLPLNQSVTVVTNTVNIAMELSKRKDVDVFVTGGHLRGDWFSLVGPTAAQSLNQMLIHTLFIGADGLDAAWGASCLSPDESYLNSAMVKHARRRVAVVDHSKIGVVAGWRICQTTDLHILITDSGATDEMIEPFRKMGVEVRRV